MSATKKQYTQQTFPGASKTRPAAEKVAENAAGKTAEPALQPNKKRQKRGDKSDPRDPQIPRGERKLDAMLKESLADATGNN